MIIPWQEIAPETLDNLIGEYILREGTDYGEHEVSYDTKIDQVKQQLKNGDAVIVFSELHETVDIKSRRDLSWTSPVAYHLFLDLHANPVITVT